VSPYLDLCLHKQTIGSTNLNALKDSRCHSTSTPTLQSRMMNQMDVDPPKQDQEVDELEDDDGFASDEEGAINEVHDLALNNPSADLLTTHQLHGTALSTSNSILTTELDYFLEMIHEGLIDLEATYQRGMYTTELPRCSSK